MTHRTAALGTALALATTTLAQVATTSPTAATDARHGAPSRSALALSRLSADPSGPVRVTRTMLGTTRCTALTRRRRRAMG